MKRERAIVSSLEGCRTASRPGKIEKEDSRAFR